MAMQGFQQQTFTTPTNLHLVGDVGGPVDAPAVILLHGGGQTRHSWSGAMRRLVDEGYRVVNYDARGHGESDWSPTGDYSLASLANDLETVIGTLRGPVALVGASMGGMTSFYAVGQKSPPLARAIVLVDIVLHPAAAGVANIQNFMSAHKGGFASLEEAAEAVAAYNPDRPRPRDPSGLRKNLRLRDDGRLYWHWDPRLIEVSPRPEPPTFGDAMVQVSGGVTVPTLLVRGSHSDIVDDAGVAELVALVPQTEVYEVEGAGHMVAGDRNDAFNDATLAFLHRHHPAR